MSDEPATANGHQGRTDKTAAQIARDIEADIIRRGRPLENRWVPSMTTKRAHERIVEAIIEGDDGLARYRTRRHLDAVASWWL